MESGPGLALLRRLEFVGFFVPPERVNPFSDKLLVQWQIRID